jgi:folate-binding protein YgfZ
VRDLTTADEAFSLPPRVQNSPLLPAHLAHGATLSAPPSPFVLTFGEVPDEYRAAREGAAAFDQTERGYVEVRGADAAAFLHRLTANHVRALVPGEGSRNLLLSSKGKVLFDFDLAVESERVVLSTRPGQAPALLAALDTYLFSEKVKLADASELHAPVDVCGPAARAQVEKLAGVRAPERDHAWIEAQFAGGPLRVAALPVAGSAGFRLDAGPERVAALWSALLAAGVAPAGRVTYDILRVEAGWAEPGVDIDENVYPQEARLERAFSLDKGCYIGQEVVAKIDTYGGLNKRLVALAVDHDDPIARGERLWRDEGGEWRDLGVCTSWAYSFVLDTGVVLAYVKRRHQAVGGEFAIGSPDRPKGRARIVALPVRPDALPITGEFE